MDVILGAMITEKTMKDANNGVYTFKVLKTADKTEIKRAVEKNFGVNVRAISTVMQKGKTLRVGSRRAEKNLAPFKKAMVSLQKGQKVGLFDLGTEKDKDDHKGHKHK